jgi:signal transduction histidine kinase
LEKKHCVLLFFIPIFVSTLIVFQGKDRWLGYTLTVLSFFVLGLTITDYRIIDGYKLDDKVIKIEWMINLLGSSVVTVMELIFILTLSNRIQRQLIVETNSINKINNELNSSINTRDRMISIMSHDVRGPLSLINSGLNLVDWEEHLQTDEKEIIKELQTSRSYRKLNRQFGTMVSKSN